MSQKTLKILLVISFAANLLVAGAVGGFFGSGLHKDLRLDYTGKTQEARARSQLRSWSATACNGSQRSA